MDQYPTRSARSVPQAHPVLPDPDYARMLSHEFSKVAAQALFAEMVDTDYATKLASSRSVYDIVILWRRGVSTSYALSYSDRRDLTVFDIADLWDAGVPSEFGVLT